MNVLVWVVHDRWTSAFVQGLHRYLPPCLPGRGPWGMPVVARCDGTASAIVPSQAGVCSSDPARLRSALRDLVEQPGLATAFGREARRHAVARYGIHRFLGDWERLLASVRVSG